MRGHLQALYDVARCIDVIGDEDVGTEWANTLRTGAGPARDRRAALLQLRAELDRVGSDDPPTTGVLGRPVTYVLGRDAAAAEELALWLATSSRVGESELYRIAEVIEEAGGRSWAIAEAEREVELAIRALESVAPAEPARDELVALTRYLTRREA